MLTRSARAGKRTRLLVRMAGLGRARLGRCSRLCGSTLPGSVALGVLLLRSFAAEGAVLTETQLDAIFIGLRVFTLPLALNFPGELFLLFLFALLLFLPLLESLWSATRHEPSCKYIL